MINKKIHTDFYVYVYLNPLKNGKFKYDDLSFVYEPFYVGKGRLDRKTEHLMPFSLKRKHPKNAIINKIKNNGLKPIILLLNQNLSIPKLAKYFKCSNSVITNNLKNYRIKKGKLIGSKNPSYSFFELNKQELYQYYILENNTFNNTIKYFKCTRNILEKNLKNYEFCKGIHNKNLNNLLNATK